ncbi:TlpA family protein disulfide reductase [Williamsia sterculiae]|nr:TlpA disulfide reductase family protein [Williamsia sterculiae]
MSSFVAPLAAITALVVGGCGTGDDAVAQGDTFQFISPGGKTVITYDPPASRKQVRDLTGPDVSTGQPLSLSSMVGKVVVINVWGSWCAPCRSESDDLEQTYEQTKGSGVAFLGIDFRDDRDSAKDFIADRAIAYPSIYDYPGLQLGKLTTPTSVVPTTMVVDKKGRAAAVFLKSISVDELKPVVTRLAAEQ